ncbi:unnamed protein product [Dimorphilus gyrociliatus]|uniref:NR LBD domain-containing protein n=1 Tax=Dimorphilus gyrociliatus TaxID=2664684 RepID=A0A7I8V911_9ANNE|nr:unnamed protein product [Dimorphilus gyrociliatus]
MVLAAVREDRMPGGRNSGALYANCDSKYKKLRKKIKKQPKQTLNLNEGSTRDIQDWLSNFHNKTKTEEICESAKVEYLSNEEDYFRNTLSYISLIQTISNCEKDEFLPTGITSLYSGQFENQFVNYLVQWAEKIPYFKQLSLEEQTKALIAKWPQLLMLIYSDNNYYLPRNHIQIIDELRDYFINTGISRIEIGLLKAFLLLSSNKIYGEEVIKTLKYHIYSTNGLDNYEERVDKFLNLLKFIEMAAEELAKNNLLFSPLLPLV